MKRVIRIMCVVLVMSVVVISCDKDDDGPVLSKLSSVKYSPNKIDAKAKAAFKGKEASMNPKNASATFKISKITKDKKSFVNPKSGGFSIDDKGRVSAEKDHKLSAGTYVLEITATDKKDKKNTKKTSITVVVK